MLVLLTKHASTLSRRQGARVPAITASDMGQEEGHAGAEPQLLPEQAARWLAGAVTPHGRTVLHYALLAGHGALAKRLYKEVFGHVIPDRAPGDWGVCCATDTGFHMSSLPVCKKTCLYVLVPWRASRPALRPAFSAQHSQYSQTVASVA